MARYMAPDLTISFLDGSITFSAAAIQRSAHSAAYDAEITADVFCEIVNRFRPVFEASVR